MSFKNLDVFRMALFGMPIIVASLGLYFDSKPYTYVVRGEPTIVCANGKEYPADANGFDSQALKAYIENGSLGGAVQAQDAKAKELCTYGVIHNFIPFRTLPPSRNYSVRNGVTSPSLDISKNSGVTLSHE